MDCDAISEESAADLSTAATATLRHHLYVVLDTCFLCNPHGLALLRRMQRLFAPGAGAKTGAGSKAGRGGLLVSAVVPKLVLGEMDKLKDAAGV